MSVRSVPSSSVPSTGSTGRPVRGQATQAQVPSVGPASGELQNPREWLGAGSQDDLAKAVQVSNELLAQMGSDLQFGFDEELGRAIVKVIDKRSGEVIRQLPSEEALEVAKALKSLTAGLLLNEKV